MRIEIEPSTTLRPAPHRRYFPIPHAAGPLARLYADEPAHCRRDWRKFAAVAANLGLLLAVFRAYHVEGRAFQILATLAFGMLPVHYLAPFAWKKPLFVAASVAGLAAVFGWSVAAVVLPVAGLLIGVCYLPLAWSARAGIIAAAALGMALVRGGLAGAAPPDGTWPVLGTMFMFRMMIYLYELKHAKRRESVVDTLSYFFLLPNYCFLHFPVVDYRTMQRGYFSRDIHSIQQTGLGMILRGTVQLLVYRLVYHGLLISAEEVAGPASLACYLVCNYLLYLRVSGQFHVACGMLHLFGFALPETHHNYLLATGFTDYWRRINIYWKDFMVRLVFNPVAFRLKRRPQWQALAAATSVVFVVTWALHAYQSFWLRGSWGLSLPDSLFWGVLGVLVLVNVQLDARHPRRRVAPGSRPNPAGFALRAAKTAGTFATICILWSLWSSPSLEAWMGLWRRALGGA
jgi:alginate O-acetyltransferase complex protein AlgI